MVLHSTAAFLGRCRVVSLAFLSWAWDSGCWPKFPNAEVRGGGLFPDLTGMVLDIGTGTCTKGWFSLGAISDGRPCILRSCIV